MSITNITRQLNTIHVTGAYTVSPDNDQVFCDATSAGFQVTLYKIGDGARHELFVAIEDDDSSGNTVTITDGTFSTTLNAAGASVHLEMDIDGAWFIAGQYPVTSSAAATSSADSAGLAASTALSTGTSAGLAGSSATSAAASLVLTNSTVGSVATSQNVSQSQNISSAGSTATSENASQSQNVSTTGSVATSQNDSQSLNVSTAQSLAIS